MKLVVKKTKSEASAYVAQLFADLIKSKSNAVLGLATGSTPLDVYANLVERYRNEEISFKEVKAFNLDEYIGIPPTHEQSYKYFMNVN
ncbi:MAG: 6-phosphogluconolactonase, partial [Bacillota bacterium]|nr:6-phosphogluconolactonase [Bacillota bacterium]